MQGKVKRLIRFPGRRCLVQGQNLTRNNNTIDKRWFTYSAGDELDVGALLSCVGVNSRDFHRPADMGSVVSKSKLTLLVPIVHIIEGQD